jgi:hypothetical protein
MDGNLWFPLGPDGWHRSEGSGEGMYTRIDVAHEPSRGSYCKDPYDHQLSNLQSGIAFHSTFAFCKHRIS